MIDAAHIAEALGGHRSGRGFLARCPAHDDSSASLAITDGRDGAPKVHCFAGCEFRDVASSLRALGLWPNSDPEAQRIYAEQKQAREREADRRWARIVMAAVLDDRERGLCVQASDVATVQRAREILRSKA